MRPMEISTTLTTEPGRPTTGSPRSWPTPGFGSYFTDHMFTVEWTPERRAGTTPAITPYGPLTLDPATAVLHYAQEIFEGHEGLPPRRRLDLGVPARGERRADGALEPPARAARAADRRLRAGRRARWSRSTSAGCPTPAGEKSLYLRPFMFATEAFLGVRPAAARHVHGDREPGRRLLQAAASMPVTLWLTDRLHPRRPRRHGRGQDRRQLRLARWSPSRRRPPRAATRSSSSTRQEGTLRRGARRHEHVLRLRRRPHRHPRARHDPRGHHPLQRSSSSPARWATRSRSAGSPSTSGATASPAARSPRSSPAAPPPSSRRSAP